MNQIPDSRKGYPATSFRRTIDKLKPPLVSQKQAQSTQSTFNTYPRIFRHLIH